MTTAVIIQARTGSSRLPGKVLRPLAGRSVLSHVLQRCAAIPGIDAVCCATTVAAADDLVEEEATKAGAVVFRGPEHDVLDRYYWAARALGAGIVLRVTSDCPLIDPEVAGAVLRLRAEAGVDYAANNMPPTWPHGVDCEAFRTEILEIAWRFATDAYDREHVTPWMRAHPDVRRANLGGPGGPAAEQRWTLDYPEDWAFLEALFQHLPAPPAWPDHQAVMAVLASYPELAAINACRRDPGRLPANTAA